MKVFIGAAVAALLLASPALAQTPSPELPPNCVGFAPAPAVPDGATAENEAIVAARDAIVAWAETRQAKLATCLADIQAARAQLNAMESAYNEAVSVQNATVQTLTDEVAEYNARTPQRNRR